MCVFWCFEFTTDTKPRWPGLVDYILPFFALPLAGIGIGLVLAVILAAAFFGIGLVWFRLLTVE